MTLPSVSVVLPTSRRPRFLAACLDGLLAQSHPAAEVIVARRSNDYESRAVLRRCRAPIHEVVLGEAGAAAAMAAGVRTARGEVICSTDDDAVPRRDWLVRLLGHFNDPSVGGVGGRDV